MSFSYGFFNSKNMDRVYTAEDFTNYLSSLICSGILDTYGDCFSVTAGTGKSVIIGTGKAWINGHYFVNDTAYTLDLSAHTDESLSRYVLIGISCDTSDAVRECRLEILSGTAATAPEIPSFHNTFEKKYLTLAAVLLRGGVETVSGITDYRSDESKCGYVKCILGKCRVTEMLAEMQQIYSMIDGIRADITGLETGTLKERIEEVWGQTEYITELATAMKERIDTLEHVTIPALESRIEALEGK